MARSGDVIEHPVTGEKIIFRQTAKETGGERMEADLIVQPNGFAAAEHVHPLQDEHFAVMTGTIRLRLDGKERDLRAGDRATVPAGAPHVWWNPSDAEARVQVELRPALDTESFFETFFGLAQSGKVNKKTGLPNPLVLALVMREFRREIVLARPPVPVQRVLFGALGAVGRLFGYRGRYSYPR
ncbi:MAG: cupin domain-containing protein [Anaerolineae bacterium]